jgi:hypothetical protein
MAAQRAPLVPKSKPNDTSPADIGGSDGAGAITRESSAGGSKPSGMNKMRRETNLDKLGGLVTLPLVVAFLARRMRSGSDAFTAAFGSASADEHLSEVHVRADGPLEQQISKAVTHATTFRYRPLAHSELAIGAGAPPPAVPIALDGDGDAVIERSPRGPRVNGGSITIHHALQTTLPSVGLQASLASLTRPFSPHVTRPFSPHVTRPFSPHVTRHFPHMSQAICCTRHSPH